MKWFFFIYLNLGVYLSYWLRKPSRDSRHTRLNFTVLFLFTYLYLVLIDNRASYRRENIQRMSLYHHKKGQQKQQKLKFRQHSMKFTIQFRFRSKNLQLLYSLHSSQLVFNDYIIFIFDFIWLLFVNRSNLICNSTEQRERCCSISSIHCDFRWPFFLLFWDTKCSRCNSVIQSSCLFASFCCRKKHIFANKQNTQKTF